MNTEHDDSELVQLGPRTAASRAMFEAMRSRLNVARLLISERVRRRLTQQELAAIAGTRQSRVSEIESADANFRFDTLDRIARALDLEVTLRPRAASVIGRSFFGFGYSGKTVKPKNPRRVEGGKKAAETRRLRQNAKLNATGPITFTPNTSTPYPEEQSA